MQKFRYQLIVGKLIVIFNTIVGSVAVLIILQLMSVSQNCSTQVAIKSSAESATAALQHAARPGDGSSDNRDNNNNKPQQQLCCCCWMWWWWWWWLHNYSATLNLPPITRSRLLTNFLACREVIVFIVGDNDRLENN